MSLWAEEHNSPVVFWSLVGFHEKMQARIACDIHPFVEFREYSDKYGQSDYIYPQRSGPEESLLVSSYSRFVHGLFYVQWTWKKINPPSMACYSRIIKSQRQLMDHSLFPPVPLSHNHYESWEFCEIQSLPHVFGKLYIQKHTIFTILTLNTS